MVMDHFKNIKIEAKIKEIDEKEFYQKFIIPQRINKNCPSKSNKKLTKLLSRFIRIMKVNSKTISCIVNRKGRVNNK